MADISQGNRAELILNPGDVYRVSTGGSATVEAVYGAPAGTTTVTASTQDFGPYAANAKLIVRAVTGSASYGINQATPLQQRNGALDDASRAALAASGVGAISTQLARMYEAAQAQTSTNDGVGFLEPRTLLASETPTITFSTTAPASDPTDPAAQAVILYGGAAIGNVTQDLTSDEKAQLGRWTAGWNRGLRAYWLGTGQYLCSAMPSGLVGNAGLGNQGNNNSPQYPINNLVTYGDFVLYGDVFYMRTRYTGPKYAVWVNDKLVTTSTGGGITSSVGGTMFTPDVNHGYIKIKFSSVGRRNIRIAHSAAGGLSDVYTRATHSIYPRFQERFGWFHIGDSFGATVGGLAGSDTPVFGSGQQMAAMFGPQLDFIDAHLGGSGFGTGTPAFLQRLEMDIAVCQPVKAITILAGQNDSAAQITANAPAFFAGLKTKFPGAPIFVFLSFAPNSYAQAQAKQDALKAVAASISDVYVIDTYGPGATGGDWLKGTGKEGATNGSGNSDLFLSSDGTHPSTEGHKNLWGRRMAQEIYRTCIAGKGW